MKPLSLNALDVRVRVDAPSRIRGLFAEVFADLIVEDDDGGDDEAADHIVWRRVDDGMWHVSFAEGGHVSPTDVAGGLAESFIEVNRLAATSVAADAAVLHAGAFEVNGCAIAVTGVSGAGKSTLVAAAALRSHGFLADEVCAIDPATGQVRPYHRPIGLRSQGAAAIGLPIPVHPLDPFVTVYPWRVSPKGRLADATPLRLITFLERRPGAVEVAPVTPAEALVRLTSLTLGTDKVERSMFRRLEQLVRTVPAVTVSYADSFAAVDALAELVRR